ncbi:MAG: FKBP-type peptidyl-prolyl cis-trans isomerase, partial [Polyangiales bacterium]
LVALLAALVAARAARRRDEGTILDAELRDDGAVVAQGRAVQIAVPPSIQAGPVVVWVERAPGAAHYRDDAPERGTRIEPGALAQHRARLAARLASRWTVAASVALLGAAPLAGWVVGGTLPSASAVTAPRVATSAEGLSVRRLRAGHGAPIGEGAQVSLHYTGSLTNGAVFDSSRSREPFRVRLGQGRLIAGFERGVRGMRVGEVRRVTIPPALGYGERGHPPTIPANATLIFEIELIGVE